MLTLPYAKETGLKNMATDWWLFENAETPTFRHYQWTESEISFGYGQDWKWAEQVTSTEIDRLIRRPTGGGIVKHGKDWTYCLVLPSLHDSFSIAPLDLYKEVHLCILSAFSKESVVTNLQPCPTKKEKTIPGNCFEEPVGWDLMNFDFSKKIAGAAMKRSRKGVLLQGTIIMQKDWNLNRLRFEDNLINCFAEMLNEKNYKVAWPDRFSSEIDKLNKQFASLDWKKNRVRN
jgi:lipoate-protein ligase A